MKKDKPEAQKRGATKPGVPKPSVPQKGMGLFGNAARGMSSRPSRIDAAVDKATGYRKGGSVKGRKKS